MQKSHGCKNSQVSTLFVIKKHFGWTSAIAVILATVAGFLNLLAFTWQIGRPDVFARSLEFWPSFPIFLLSYFLILLAVLLFIMSTSYLFATIVLWLRPKPSLADKLVPELFLSITAIMTGIITLTLVLSHPKITSYSPWWLFIIALPSSFLSWNFITRHAGKAEALASPATRRGKGISWLILTLLLTLTAISGVLPAWLVINLYEDSSTIPEFFQMIKIMLSCLTAMVASLAPAVLFFMRTEAGISEQIKGGMHGFLILFALLFLATPTIFSHISVGSITALGISEREVRRYLVDSDKYPPNHLNNKKWDIKDPDEKPYSLSAFALYNYGSTTLLCPAELSIIKTKELRRHTEDCILFDKDSVRALSIISVESGEKLGTR